MALFTRTIDSSPLHEACRTNQHKLANALIKQGSPLEAPCKLTYLVCRFWVSNLTPLQVACGNGCFETASMLLNLGANIEFKGDRANHMDRTTPLILAAGGGHLDVVRLLLQHKADLQARDWFAETPLTAAVRHNQSAVVRVLLDHHADIERISYDHPWTLAFNSACSFGHLDIIKLMIAWGSVHINGGVVNTGLPLDSACSGGWLAAVKLLRDHGADINKRTPDGYSPIMRALISGRKEVVDFLLVEKGASFTENDMVRAFHDICRGGGHLDMFDFLISSKVPVDVANEDGLTPLHVACQGGHKDIVERLLPLVKNCDKSANGGETPLLLACRVWKNPKNRCDIVKSLLARNADVNAVSNRGHTSLGRACRCGGREMVELLLSAGASIRDTEHESYVTIACLAIDIEVVDVLCFHGAAVYPSELTRKRLQTSTRSQCTGLQCAFLALNYRFILLHRMAWMTLCAKRATFNPGNRVDPSQDLNNKRSRGALTALLQSELSWTAFQLIFRELPLEHVDYLQSH